MDRACLTCGGETSERLFGKAGIPYRRCPACGLAFSTPTANANFATALCARAVRHGFEKRGFARLGRRKSVGYVLQYFVDFVLGGRLRVPRRLERLLVPINLHDSMYVAFSRRAGG
jgi:hypothetical protein